MKKESIFLKHFTKIIVGVIFLSLLTLFFFPEPETNFFAYLCTGGMYILVVVFLVSIKKRNK